MTWEDPDVLPKMKPGREEYLQRMLTSLILGRSCPRWNTRNPPSTPGDSFLRDLIIPKKLSNKAPSTITTMATGLRRRWRKGA